jgi:hypothetical protein
MRRGKGLAFEYPGPAGTVSLMKTKGVWKVGFAGKVLGRWRSPEAAALAVARHRTGLPDWDQKRLPVSDDLLDWRPLGDSI